MWLLALALISVMEFSKDQANGKTKIEIWDGKGWVESELRTIDDLKSFTPVQKSALSKYGARLDRQVRATGFFRTEQVDGRWWLFYQNRVLGFLGNPGGVGWHWFKYGGQADTSHRGVVNRDYQPCLPLMNIVKTVNKQVYPLADYFLRERNPLEGKKE